MLSNLLKIGDAAPKMKYKMIEINIGLISGLTASINVTFSDENNI